MKVFDTYKHTLPWRCRWLGHKVESFESGYCVCSRCGGHEYHCYPEFQQAGLVAYPIWKARSLIRSLTETLRWKYYQWKNRHKNDDVPF